ncbi:MAG: AI-2E family transporter [Saccharofermentanales bacterium]|jgi:sporulation integral membrane protein YtvI|nr:AI-2E family transporter [Bacillota bacterium]NLB08216.1 AI-2E family transporter [Clostridiales bacterium]
MDNRAKTDLAFILSFIKHLLLLILIAVLLFIGSRALVILAPILFALVLSQAAVTISRFILEFRQKYNAGQALTRHPHRVQKKLSVFVYIVILLLLLALIGGLMYYLVSIIRYVYYQFPNLIRESEILEKISNIFNDSNRLLGIELNPTISTKIEESVISVAQKIIAALPGVLAAMLQSVSRMISGLPRTILVLLITVMAGYYFITESNKLYALLLRFIPDRVFVRKLFSVTNRLTKTLFRILGGYIVLLAFTFLISLIGFLIIGVPNAVTWAIVAAVVDLLPILGITTTLIPMSLYFFIQSLPWQAVGVLILMVSIIVLRRFIEPTILGNAMELHPIVTLLSMIIGIMIYGLGGLLLGPLAFVILRELFVAFEMEQKIRQIFAELMVKRERADLDEQ